ncbi:MAG: RNA polymerase sigma factor [Ruminococcus sp.]
MENLVKKAKERDAEAFTLLMQSYMQHMYKTARAILKSDEDAADAISDTILVCWEKLPDLSHDRYFKTWMTRILVNKCKDFIAKKKQLVLTDEMPEGASYETGYENLEWQEAMKSLDEKYRLVVMLYYGEGFRTSEVASILDISESTVRTRLARAREKLAEGYYSEVRRRII